MMRFSRPVDKTKALGLNTCWAILYILALPDAVFCAQKELECDTSSPLTSVCILRGDVRVDLRSGQIALYAQSSETERGVTYVRPHPRKWDKDLMQSTVTQLEIKTVGSDDPGGPPLECSKRNAAPGVVFSVGGFAGTPFHDFNEVFLPLFQTVHPYTRDVILLMSDLKGEAWWRDNPPKQSFVGAMTQHAIRLIGTEHDTYSRLQGVECFDQLTVGLYHDLCMYDEHGGSDRRSANAKGFAPFIREGLQVPPQKMSEVFVPQGTAPVIGIVQRGTTRKFVNYEELLEVATGEGFNVVPVRFENLNHVQATELMSTLDVLVGVHGAGLSNVCLMRPGGALMQIMPYGEGGPRDVTGMELKNMAQEIGQEYYEWRVPVVDSTIKDEYNHSDLAVTSPLSIWKGRTSEEAMHLYHNQDVKMPADLFVAFLRQIRRMLNSKAERAQALRNKPSL